jgi:hypothetical protein
MYGLKVGNRSLRGTKQSEPRTIPDFYQAVPSKSVKSVDILVNRFHKFRLAYHFCAEAFQVFCIHLAIE